jgi:hypothetical protein
MRYSRFLLCVLSLFICPVLIFAQDHKSIGIKGGWSLSNFWGDGTDKLNNSLRSVSPGLDERNLSWFTVGVFTKKEIIPDFLAFQTELNYWRGGKAWKGRIGGAERYFDVEIDYIQMPWIAKIQIPIVFKPSIYAGPEISWMWRSRADNLPPTANTTPFFAGTNVNGEVFEQYTKVIDIGFVAGIDIGIPFGPGSIVLDGRFLLGALNTFNYSAAQEVRNYSFMFMGGYAIDFGKSL